MQTSARTEQKGSKTSILQSPEQITPPIVLAEERFMDAMADRAPAVPVPRQGSALEVLGVSARLGLTSFADRSLT